MHVIPMSSLYGLKNTNQNQSPKRLSIYPKATQLINGIHPNYFLFYSTHIYWFGIMYKAPRLELGRDRYE